MFIDLNTPNMEEPADHVSGILPFVGRRKVLEDIKTGLSNETRLAQLFGQPMVGKARTAKQVQLELAKEFEGNGRHVMSVEMCCRDISDWTDLLTDFQNALGWNDIACKETAIFTKLKNVMRNKPSHIFLFLFLKCEKLGNEKSSLAEKFDILITKLIELSKNVFVIVTTQKVFSFKGVKHIITNVLPMTREESNHLFKRCFSDVDVEPFLPAVDTHGLGLPSLIMEAASQLKLHMPEIPDITLEDFEDIFQLCKETLLDHPSNLEVFDGLNECTKSILIDLSIFQGSFGVTQLETVFNKRPSQVKAIIVKLEQCSQLVQDKNKNRMRIHPAVENYIRNSLPGHITYNDTVRLRFVKLFGQVLKKVDSEITVRPEQHIYQHLHPDWLNFQQLLKEAIHCTQDTYKPFLQVANEAETVLIKFFPEEALNFYTSMVNASEKFGNDLEQAKQKWLLGRAKTRGKGTEYDGAMGLFKEALPAIVSSDDYYAHVSLLADMAYNYYKQGDYRTALGFFEEALQEAGRHESSDRLLNKVLSIRCDTAIQLIFLNEPDSAEHILVETMKVITVVAPYHPAIPIMINSLGLICERARHDNENALRNYSSSLHERRKYATLAPADLVVPLNNVAMQYSRRGNHDHALKLLDEAFSIRKKLGWKDFHTGLTCLHMGCVQMALLHFEEAVEYTKLSLEIFRTCTKNHHVQVMVLSAMAHCLAGLEKWHDSADCLKEAVAVSEKYQKKCPSDETIQLVRKHLYVALRGHQQGLRSFFESRKSEIHRQLSLCRDRHENMYFKWQRELVELCKTESTFFTNEIGSNKDASELLSECVYCSSMRNSGFDAFGMWNKVEREVTRRAAVFQQLVQSPGPTEAMGITNGIGRMTEVVSGVMLQANPHRRDMLVTNQQASTGGKDVNQSYLHNNQTNTMHKIYADPKAQLSCTDQNHSYCPRSGHCAAWQCVATNETINNVNTPNAQTCAEIQNANVYPHADKSVHDEMPCIKEHPKNNDTMIRHDGKHVYENSSQENVSHVDLSKSSDCLGLHTENTSDTSILNKQFSQESKGLGIRLTLLSQGVSNKPNSITERGVSCRTADQKDKYFKEDLDMNTVGEPANPAVTEPDNNAPCQHKEKMNSGNPVFSSDTNRQKDKPQDRTVPNANRCAIWPPNHPRYVTESQSIVASLAVGHILDNNLEGIDLENRNTSGNSVFLGTSESNLNQFPGRYDNFPRHEPTHKNTVQLVSANMEMQGYSLGSVHSGSSVYADCEPGEILSPPLMKSNQVDIQIPINTRISVGSRYEWGCVTREPMENDDRDK
ncbi:uncharacterized protein LOC121382681 [Gigantopelta aegis]|uniref:uncharacterized protein LOC121382681 n=1 Tax=Gigantopelta aegis TaxID=1735272 RepID=UPI001B88D3C1|nr:uncharacterized protein LOC121382681 [Gigantopelta aegis]XP_041368151.1 uncharacterized protein LOC121382681 [Gigantopelta aegis]XP_041368152.1 uncharacterized protein LOC121382681 [Gigantopelta aegis]XP_041368153.1 uncharacterized protein LOC121382681 [Gigantopelta aegis]